MDGLSTEILIESLYKYYEKNEPVQEISIEAFEDYIAFKDQKKKLKIMMMTRLFGKRSSQSCHQDRSLKR